METLLARGGFIFMQLSLLDILKSDQYQQQDDIQAKLVSVQQHLLRLFNTRQGSLQHMPDYGLPDLNHIYQDLPHSTINLSEHLSQLIEKYEPRLTDVEVSEHKDKDKDYILAFDVYANLIPAYPVLYSTYFLSGGHTEVLYR